MCYGNIHVGMQTINFQAMARLGSKLLEADSSKVSSIDNSGDKSRPFSASIWEVKHHAATLEDLGWTREMQELFSSEGMDVGACLDAGAQAKLKCIRTPLHQLSLAGFSAASFTAITIGKEVLTKALQQLQEVQQQEDQVGRKAWLAMCGELQKHSNRHPT
jgi:hypothetical protein